MNAALASTDGTSLPWKDSRLLVLRPNTPASYFDIHSKTPAEKVKIFQLAAPFL